MFAVGANGAGKTNLLEALHVATQGISPRTRQDARLVRHGAEGFRVTAEGVEEGGDIRIEVTLATGRGKQARLNGTPLSSIDRLRSAVATLVFTPDRLAVVKAGPAVRRSYVDRTLARVFPARASLSRTYAEALAQRNAALRRVAASALSPDAVEPWSDQVSWLGDELVSARTDVVSQLARGFHERAGELGLAAAGIEYLPCRATREGLAQSLPRDIARGLTSLGPHLDEVRFLADGHDLRAHGSQGEQRVAVLALLLAEAELLADRRSVPPLLLLDDVLSELDGDRRAALVTRLRAGGQTLVTAAVRGALPGDPDQLLAVRPGSVVSG